MQQQSGNVQGIVSEGCFSRVAGRSLLMIWISGPYEFATSTAPHSMSCWQLTAREVYD
jgi:hypothetical protein